MISQQAKQGVEYIFLKAAKANLVLDANDTCQIVPVGDAEVKEFPEKTIIVLTISSFLFRMLIIIHINEDVATTDYFKGGASDKPLVDVVSEMGNMCCGAMNRELHRYFNHLGLSTPYVLSKASMAFLKELKPGHIAAYAITINDSVQMHVTLCLCENAPIDFTVDTSSAEEETGALELF